MKKALFVLWIMTLSFASFGQKLEGYVVTKANDTIPCRFLVQTNMFTKNLFYATSVYNSVKILNDKGEKIKYYPKDLNSFFIRGTAEGNFKFVSFAEDGYKHFYHEEVKDRLSYYKLYHKHGNTFPNSVFKEFVYKDGVFLQLGLFNTRKNLAALIDDNKEIHDKWVDENGYYKVRDAVNIIYQYNDYYKTKPAQE